jgi:predicted GIY-YIG superfamily endonuclease
MYILLCSDNTYYVGSTTNAEARIALHHAGEGGDYTARRRPLQVAFVEEFPTLHEAFLAERQVKGWSRAKKEALIRRDYGALPELARNHQGQEETPDPTER